MVPKTKNNVWWSTSVTGTFPRYVVVSFQKLYVKSKSSTFLKRLINLLLQNLVKYGPGFYPSTFSTVIFPWKIQSLMASFEENLTRKIHLTFQCVE